MSLLVVTGLSKRFGGLWAVKDLGFELAAGHILGIIGPNGAGKTSLFNLLTGFLPADSGSVRLAGTELLGRRTHAIARLGLARTFQLARPFAGLTVLESLLLPLGLPGRCTGATEQRGQAGVLLETLGLSHKADTPSEALNQGELRLLDIGRALACGPRLLLLDEPFSGLGMQAVARVAQCLRERREAGDTTLIIEHRLRELMPLIDRALVLNFGARLAEGTPQAIAGNVQVIEAYLGRRGVLA
ncbi:ABC transporter ATP-binding protein [Mitsuaria sp. WAJ17]|uniref:ABC transporter ATP-binding protein n=1 Tax=Mitsuaria sp. WAJ17 TaxID=2761452 RepID=UPI0016012EAE|nr:ABC transporter ATP-binding protein [Mitsuaria sp. WAJ17]MBB2485474.1 ABC transporter ATP-binding protein [Mitsuaria sp. WAJ17]